MPPTCTLVPWGSVRNSQKHKNTISDPGIRDCLSHSGMKIQRSGSSFCIQDWLAGFPCFNDSEMDLRFITNTDMFSLTLFCPRPLILINQEYLSCYFLAAFLELILQEITRAVDVDLLKPTRNTRTKVGQHALETWNVVKQCLVFFLASQGVQTSYLPVMLGSLDNCLQGCSCPGPTQLPPGLGISADLQPI